MELVYRAQKNLRQGVAWRHPRGNLAREGLTRHVAPSRGAAAISSTIPRATRRKLWLSAEVRSLTKQGMFEMIREGRSRRHAVLGLVIAVHALLVALALRHHEALKILREHTISLIFLNAPAPVPPPVAAPPDKTRDAPSAAPSKRAAKDKAEKDRDAEQDAGDFAISLDTQDATPAGELPLRLGIDWDNEASTVADAQAVSIFRELKALCDQAAKRGDPPPPGCRKHRIPPAWEPQPKQFGFTDGPGLRLPYMRMGRCVVGLGFFGCGFGKRPEANGHVFDDFRDPDRPRSSVPDPNDPD